MKKAPEIYSVEEIMKYANNDLTCIDGKWVPARPLGYYSLKWRLKCMWMVFTGKADVIIWPGGQ